MYDEDDLLPISALQHLAFCPRQWGLIYLEGLWDDNTLTAQGSQMHRRVHEAPGETRGDVRIARGLPLRSLRLGLSGVADVVEFHAYRGPPDASACALSGLHGLWKPFPVEHKRGRPKPGPCDAVQLCAQALCLEEMLTVRIPSGALFYGARRRRTDVEFTADLRRHTEELAALLHQLQDAGRTPPPRPGPACRNCSLNNTCLPKAAGRSAARYLASAFKEPGQ